MHPEDHPANTRRNLCEAVPENQQYPIAAWGVWVDAVRERQPVIHNDYAALSHKKGLPEGHAPVSRELVAPVSRGDKIVAILGVGNKPDPYGDSDIATVQKLADFAWEIVQRKQTEEFLKHRTAELEQRTAELAHANAVLEQLATVFTHAREGIFITDPDGVIIEVNEAFARITGYRRAEAIGQNPRLLQSGRHTPEFYAGMWRALLDVGHWSGEIWNRRRNGEGYPEFLTISAVRDGAGVTRQYVALFADITAQKEHQSQLEHVAHYDALTGLPNRNLLADRLRQAMAQAVRRGSNLAIAFLDLDGFKAINDRHGHDVGDRLLCVVAERMKQSLREGDTVARLGGDEFVAVLLDLPAIETCVPTLVRLLDAAAEEVVDEGVALRVSASLGVTFYPQAEALDADQLLRQADQAMYQAKLTGKNRYQFFEMAHD